MDVNRRMDKSMNNDVIKARGTRNSTTCEYRILIARGVLKDKCLKIQRSLSHALHRDNRSSRGIKSF